MLLGRRSEEATVRGLVDGLRDGEGGVLLVVGDPGIGKSTLIDLARREATRGGLRVLSTTGVPAESRLPYAGLHQLLLPLRGCLDRLPAPQRDVIRTAFGRRSEPVPDRFLVPWTVTELLGEAAAQEPLLVVADDAHWLDPATCDVLAFAARRVGLGPIGMLVALRDGYDLPLLSAGLPELRLRGLDEESACALVESHAPGLPAESRQRILTAALGNPLALTELALGTAAQEGSAAALAGGALTLSTRIEKAFAARWSELPDRTRTVLLVAALNEGGALAETLDATSRVLGVDIGADALREAVAARLVEAGVGGLRFRHPLVRSAIEQSADLCDVLAAHSALAEVLTDQPDRRAWHRAAATMGPDEDVAAELDEAASRAVGRSALALAVAAEERAAELSRNSLARDTRLLRAAQLSFELGQSAMVERLVGRISRTGLGVVARGRLALLQESVEESPTESTERVLHLVELAREVAAAGERDLAMEVLLGAARRCWWVDPGRSVRLLVADTAHEAADSPTHPTLQSVLALAAPDEYGGAVRERLDILARHRGLEPVQHAHLGIAGTTVGAWERSRVFFAAAIPRLRTERRLGPLVRALNHEAYCAIHTCDWAAAQAAAEESEAVAVEAGQHRWVALAKVPQAVVAGLRGDAETVGRLASEAERVLVAAGTSCAMAYLQIARGQAALGTGNYHEAYAHLVRVFDPTDKASHHLLRFYAPADLADAAVRSGHQEEAKAVLAELEGAAGEFAPVVAVNLAFARAVLADDDDADALLEEALTRDLRRWPFHYARLKLEYGAWLRRHRRAVESRPHLRTARDMLEAIGALGWRERAEQELRASGIRPQPRSDSRFEELTAREQQIARMVVEGLSNREIAERLSLSHRTVGYHLYRMFPKLGITSRAELHAVVADA